VEQAGSGPAGNRLLNQIAKRFCEGEFGALTTQVIGRGASFERPRLGVQSFGGEFA